jgi:Protein of unknown function (DUF3592)
MEDSGTALEIRGEEIPAATKEDVERALARQPRADDWYLSLSRPNDDYMDVYLEDGTLQVQCEESGRTLNSASAVDEAILKSLLLSFLARDDSWSTQCKWEMPPHAGPPVFAILSRMREVRRAATWKQGNARILRSELVTKERKRAGETARTVTLPAVEYEFSIGFNKFYGNRISIGEIMPDTPEVQETLERYRVGTSVPVYYDPANPKESVLERELPRNFALIWVLVAVVAIISVGSALWFIGAFK